jgi:hypothetical protein
LQKLQEISPELVVSLVASVARCASNKPSIMRVVAAAQ